MYSSSERFIKGLMVQLSFCIWIQEIFQCRCKGAAFRNYCNTFSARLLLQSCCFLSKLASHKRDVFQLYVLLHGWNRHIHTRVNVFSFFFTKKKKNKSLLLLQSVISSNHSWKASAQALIQNKKGWTMTSKLHKSTGNKPWCIFFFLHHLHSTFFL